MSQIIQSTTEEAILHWNKFMISETCPYKDNTINGECAKCGDCCSAILPLSEHDILVINEYIKFHDIQACSHCPPDRQGVVDMLCPFLDKNKSCTIYAARPLICKAFKCDKRSVSKNYTKILKRRKLFMSNLWGIFFNKHEADFILLGMRQFLR